MLVRTIIHYALHLLLPLLAALLFFRERPWKAYLAMLAMMIIDVDHLWADPIFDPNRCSVGFHPLHSYPAVILYFILCILPYQKLRLPWWLRAVAIGLILHILTDLEDYYCWL